MVPTSIGQVTIGQVTIGQVTINRASLAAPVVPPLRDLIDGRVRQASVG
ncbi:MAG TPA: hypothetical protein VG496_19690 [Myxococcales bacterium]|nr:hypothetical protein [Myxococcales bacterium]